MNLAPTNLTHCLLALHGIAFFSHLPNIPLSHTHIVLPGIALYV
jgi:hypothetical protein